MLLGLVGLMVGPQAAQAADPAVAAKLATLPAGTKVLEDGVDVSKLRRNAVHVFSKGRVYELPMQLTKGAPAGRVSAQAVNGCPTSSETGGYGALCLYKWINWQGGRWQTRMDTGANWPATLSSDRGGCWNYSGSSFGAPHAGEPVNNEAGSITVTASTSAPTNAPNTSPGPHVWYWVLFDWVSCQSAGDFMFTPIEYSWYDSTLQWGPGGIYESWYHRPTSFQTASDVALGHMIG
jgi:hypothetical protein